jgi:HK97 family phage prohead protease
MRQTQFKSLDYQIKDIDTTKGIVEFYSSSFGSGPDDKDSDGDVMVKGAYKKTIQENFKRIRHLKNHQISVGVPLEIKEDDFGLLVKSQLILGKQVAKELFEEYKTYAELGNSMEHSVGFVPINSKEDKENSVNYIREVKLMDVTTMETWGANENTPQGALKRFGSIQNAVDSLDALLKAKLPDSKLEQIENLMNQIKALSEPPDGTRHEPPENPEPAEATQWEYVIENLKI